MNLGESLDLKKAKSKVHQMVLQMGNWRVLQRDCLMDHEMETHWEMHSMKDFPMEQYLGRNFR